MTQVLPAFSSHAGSTSVWQRMMHCTPMSSARRIISGWLPQRMMLSGSEKSRLSQLCGRAIVTTPDTRSTCSAPSLRMRPSMTLRRLNSGNASTCRSLIVRML